MGRFFLSALLVRFFVFAAASVLVSLELVPGLEFVCMFVCKSSLFLGF
jgi:hypothetical protein